MWSEYVPTSTNYISLDPSFLVFLVSHSGVNFTCIIRGASFELCHQWYLVPFIGELRHEQSRKNSSHGQLSHIVSKDTDA